MNEQERYEQICQPEFTEIKGGLKQIIALLQDNGKPGLCSTVRVQGEKIKALENWRICLISAITAIALPLIVAGISTVAKHISNNTAKVEAKP